MNIILFVYWLEELVNYRIYMEKMSMKPLARFHWRWDDDKMAEIMVNIGDDYELISVLRNLHDWSVLAEVLDAESGITTISEAKVKIYEQHKADLKTLKYFIRKYCPTKYDMVFREARNRQLCGVFVSCQPRDQQTRSKARRILKLSRSFLKK